MHQHVRATDSIHSGAAAATLLDARRHTRANKTSLLCVVDAMKYLVLINIGAVSHITASRDIGAQIKMHHLVAFEAAADGDKRRQMSNGHLS